MLDLQKAFDTVDHDILCRKLQKMGVEEVDGVLYPGIVKEKQEAKKTYEKAKRKGQSAGHIFYKPRDTNKFRVTINIAAQSEVTFQLTYDELLQRKRGQYEHIIYIDPKQVVDQLLVEVFIYESREITALRIPPVRNDILSNSFEISTSNDLALVERPSPKTAYIRYNPSPEEQKKDSAQGVSGLFKVQYDVQRSLDAGDIYVVDGYFTHFFAPVGLAPLRKRILFVLDISGSMSFSRKITQLKEAMTQILSQLNDEDYFNIVTFESNSHPWSPEMKKANSDNINEATEFVQNLIAEGGTNVHDALTDGLDILQNSNDVGVNAPIIVFLTDGDPTVGVTNFNEILNAVESKNKNKIQIFSLAFGSDANFEFLKKISARNNAFARKIYTDADAMLQLTGFYNEISDVLLSKVSFTYLDDTVNLTSLTQSQYPSFFDGSELVVSGKLNELDSDFNALTLSVVGNGNKGVIELSSTTKIENQGKNNIPDFKTRLDYSTIVEKTWAYLTIKKLLKEELITENDLLKEEIKLDALHLALDYNFVTPMTSMVVTKPERKKENDTKETNNVQEDDANALEGYNDPGTAALTGSSGTLSLAGNKAKFMTDSDPHFIVTVKGLDYAICFDVMGEEGDVYKLITDTYSGLTVDAKVVANKMVVNGANVSHHSNPSEIKTFLGEIHIKRRRMELTVTPTKITLMGETIDWTNGTTLSHGKTKIVIDQAGSMVVVMFYDRVTFLVMRHLRSKSLLRAGKVNFLGLYIVEYKGLSYHTHGLLGQFLHRNVILKKTKNRKGKLMGRLRVSGNTQRPRKVMATLGHRLNLAKNETVSCWMVQHNGDALLDGKITDYLIKRGSSDESGLNISNENKQQEKQGKISNVKHKLEKIKPDSEKDSK
ncbi:inter-alpha-trypsin inhibitor heavy chain H3-like [Ruditapes philippinarum]|uniref:inter-alpha-trypsin inhibitor heavy chain H3-like n=1 Tax=Ruditapes philippinarum TaxID=129788 RepID=UPI00295A8B14|nr:inter-alpha-trypsin inhibitor heavy chain H3-like [Ruditapes philippinarum]